MTTEDDAAEVARVAHVAAKAHAGRLNRVESFRQHPDLWRELLGCAWENAQKAAARGYCGGQVFVSAKRGACNAGYHLGSGRGSPEKREFPEQFGDNEFGERLLGDHLTDPRGHPSEAERDFREFLAALPIGRSDRDFLVARFVLGLRPDELAAVYGCHYQTVFYRQRKLFAVLRSFLAARGRECVA